MDPRRRVRTGAGRADEDFRKKRKSSQVLRRRLTKPCDAAGILAPRVVALHPTPRHFHLSTARSPKAASPAALRRSVIDALESLKAKDIIEIDVRGKTSIADLLVIASGTSVRHVKSIADEVVKFAKRDGVMPLGVEGEQEGEWVLVDLGDVIVHVMLPRVREFYSLERLWAPGEAAHDGGVASAG